MTTSGQRQSLNLIFALNNKGKFWCSAHSGRFTADKFIALLKSFRRGRRQNIVLILDSHPVHRSKKVASYIQSLKGKIELEFFPTYTTDINPDEQVWNQVRHEGPIKTPLKKEESLKSKVIKIMEGIKGNKKLVRSFFQHPDVAFAANLVVILSVISSTDNQVNAT